MKQDSSKKFVTIEDHHLILEPEDLTHAIEAADPETVGDEELELQTVLVVNGEAIDAEGLLTMLRSMNPAIPEDATFTLAVKWQEQVEFDPSQLVAQQAPTGPLSPQQTRQQMQQLAPNGQPYHQQQQFTPQYAQQMQQQYAPAQQPQFRQPMAPGAQQCRTCGAVPDVQGPTPDCMDAAGCGRVLRERGQLLPPRTVPPPGAPGVGMGPGRVGPGKLVNRATGEVAFADRNGMPYGKHDDYQKR